MSFASLTSTHAVGPRQAALMIRAMSHQDQVWLMSQLSDAQKSLITTLQTELDALGVAPSILSAELGSGLLNAADTSGLNDPEALETPDEAFLMALNDSDVASLVQACLHEPPSLVMQSLRLRDWPWRQRFMTQWQLTMPGADMDRLDPMPWHRQEDRAFERSLMHQLRRVCEQARRSASARPPEPGPQGPSCRKRPWSLICWIHRIIGRNHV